MPDSTFEKNISFRPAFRSICCCLFLLPLFHPPPPPPTAHSLFKCNPAKRHCICSLGGTMKATTSSSKSVVRNLPGDSQPPIPKTREMKTPTLGSAE
jgi:hypothetical protein